MTRELLISLARPGECWFAVVQDGAPERVWAEPLPPDRAGNIYKGHVVAVEPGIQAAFVDFGGDRNGFLHVSDVEPAYYRTRTPPREQPPIQAVFRRGQEVVVQFIKESVGGKSPTLSTHLSIASRYLVLMPSLDRIGVSRKIESEEERRRLRETLEQLDLPGGVGFVARTAAAGQDPADLQEDGDYLARLWALVARRVRAKRAPAEVYRERDFVLGLVADPERLSGVDTVWIDDAAACERAREYLDALRPGNTGAVKHHAGAQPLFTKYGIAQDDFPREAPPG